MTIFRTARYPNRHGVLLRQVRMWLAAVGRTSWTVGFELTCPVQYTALGSIASSLRSGLLHQMCLYTLQP